MNLSELIPILVLNRLNPALTEVLQSLDVVFDVQEFAHKDYLLSQVTELSYFGEKVKGPLLKIDNQELSEWTDRVSHIRTPPVQIEEEVTIKFALLDLIRRKQKICRGLLENMFPTEAERKKLNLSVQGHAGIVTIVPSSEINEPGSRKQKFDFSLPPEKNLERIFGRLNRQIFFEESSSKGMHKVIFRDQNRRVMMAYQGNCRERATLVMLMTLDKLLKVNNKQLRKYYHNLDEEIRQKSRIKRPVQSKEVSGNFVPFVNTPKPKIPLVSKLSEPVSTGAPVQTKTSVFDKLARIVQNITERICRTTPLIGEKRLKILKLARREGFFDEFCAAKIKHHLTQLSNFDKIVLFFEVLSQIFTGCARDLGFPLRLGFVNFFDQKHGTSQFRPNFPFSNQRTLLHQSQNFRWAPVAIVHLRHDRLGLHFDFTGTVHDSVRHRKRRYRCVYFQIQTTSQDRRKWAGAGGQRGKGHFAGDQG